MSSNKNKPSNSSKQNQPENKKPPQNPSKPKAENNPSNSKDTTVKQVNQKENTAKPKPQINTSTVKKPEEPSPLTNKPSNNKDTTVKQANQKENTANPKPQINTSPVKKQEELSPSTNKPLNTKETIVKQVNQKENTAKIKPQINTTTVKKPEEPSLPTSKGNSSKKAPDQGSSSLNKPAGIQSPLSRQPNNLLPQNSKLFESTMVENSTKENGDNDTKSKVYEGDDDDMPETVDHRGHLNEDDEESYNTIKPRVNYLQGKIDEMNFSKDLVAGVSRGLNVSLMSIKDGFITSQLPVSKSQKDILFPKIYPPKPVIKTNITRLHTIKELKNNELALKNTISQLNQNQKLLENESFFNLSTSQLENNTVNNTVRKSKIKEIKYQKEQLVNRLMEVTSKIAELAQKESIDNGQFNNTIKYNLSKFEENFEKDKMNLVRRIRRLQKESVSRQQRMNNDLGERLSLREQQIMRREKSEEKKKMMMIENLRQQEKEVILKRQQQNNEKIMKVKDFLKEKNKNKSYAYLNLNKRYQAHENQLVQMETIRRKDYMKHIKSDEFNEFSHKCYIDKGKMEEELVEKAKKLHELWHERSKLIPEYVHPMLLKCNDEKAIEQALEEEMREQLEINRTKMKNYASEITQPKPNPVLTNLRMEKISKVSIRRTLQTRPRNNSYSNRIINHSDDSSGTELKLKDINTVDMKDYPKLKPTKLIKKASEVTSAKRNRNNIHQVDYLEERRKIKCCKETDWNKEMSKEKDRTSLREGIMHIHDKAALMDIKIKQKEQLLRLNGGVGQHPEICDEVSDLMINSIKAKLSIIDTAVNIKENDLNNL